MFKAFVGKDRDSQKGKDREYVYCSQKALLKIPEIDSQKLQKGPLQEALFHKNAFLETATIFPIFPFLGIPIVPQKSKKKDRIAATLICSDKGYFCLRPV